MINRKIRYYVNLESLDGFNDDENQYLDAEANLIDIVHRITYCENQPISVSEVLIEDLQTHQINVIDYRLLIEFVD